MAALLVVGLLHDRLAPYGWIESRVGRSVALGMLLPAVLVPASLFVIR